MLQVLRIEYEKARTGGIPGNQAGVYQAGYGTYAPQGQAQGGQDQYAGYYVSGLPPLSDGFPDSSSNRETTVRPETVRKALRPRLPEALLLERALFLNKGQKRTNSMPLIGQHTATMSTTRSVSVSYSESAEVDPLVKAWQESQAAGQAAGQ